MKKRAFNMPFKSEAQRAKFAQLVAEGKMSQETFDNWQKATGDKKLPDRLNDAPMKIKKIKKIK